MMMLVLEDSISYCKVRMRARSHNQSSQRSKAQRWPWAGWVSEQRWWMALGEETGSCMTAQEDNSVATGFPDQLELLPTYYVASESMCM